MHSSSLFLSPSSTNERASAAVGLPASSSALTDVVPFEAALQRLLYENIHSDEQLASYGVQQAYRGLLYAVRAKMVTLKARANEGASSSYPYPSPQTINKDSANQSVQASNPSTGGIHVCVVRGWQAVLYRLALAAVRSPSELECAVFLSTRILCDPASAHGEGNERPCCTAEWTHALLGGLPRGDRTDLPLTSSPASAFAVSASLDESFHRLAQTNRRYQLGYLLIVSNTLRMVASGRVDGRHLCSDYPQLFNGAATELLPHFARCAEESVRDAEASSSGLRSSQPHASSAACPSRISAELNHAVLHGGYWLTMDALSAHMEADDVEETGEMPLDANGQRVVKPRSKKKKKHPLVLDRDQPAQLWACVTLVRNALRRALNWLQEEAKQHGSVETGNRGRSPSEVSCVLLKEVSQQLEGVVTDLLKRHEYLQNALTNALRAYNGIVTNDAQLLTDMMWAHTLQMCFLVRNLTGVWVCVHGGLGYSVLCADQLLPNNRDVLMSVASALLRIPALETKQEEEREVFLGVDATLCALLTLVAAAPTPALQNELWASDATVTQQVHAVLVQRALRYRNERILKSASLLSRAVLDAAVQTGALAGFATDSADQLLELLESSDDAASRCVGELLSVAILHHPYRLVPALFRLLQHGSASTRRNVLQVLCSLPDLLGETTTDAVDDDEPDASSTTMVAARADVTRRRDVLRLLAENLLIQVQDEELCVRMLSSSLFAKVHPGDVLQPLLNMCVQRDVSGKRQSAALAALTSVLTAHTRSATTYVLLLRSAYQCHSDIKRSHTDAPPQLESGTVHLEKELASESAARSQLHRPVPQTPGDILSHTLLYSTADVGGQDEESGGEGKQRDSISHIDDAAALSVAPSGTAAGAFRRKETHLSSAVVSLTDRWVQAALPSWTYARHSVPLLECLTLAAFDPDATATTEGADVEDQVQFYMKFTLRATSAITGAAAAGKTPEATPTECVTACASHLLSIWSAFFAGRAPSRNESVLGESWSAVTMSDKKKLDSDKPGSASANARVHAALLPLLCLRSCAPGTFAKARALADIFNPNTTPLDERAASDAVKALTEGSTADKEGAYQQIVSALWHTLWSAVSHTASAKAFFTAYPDIQRVLLEVLCRFPACVFFAHWEAWKLTVIDSDDNGATAEALFMYRVYMFATSAYLAASLNAPHGCSAVASPQSFASSASLRPDLEVVLQHRSTLLHVLTTILPRWLLEDGEAATRLKGAGDVEVETAKQRLCMAAVDAGGVLGVVALAHPLRLSTPASPAVEADVLQHELETTCNELLSVPLVNLTLAYRATTEQESASVQQQPSSETETAGPADTHWAMLLTQFQLCLRMHASLLRGVAVYPQKAKGLLLLWFRRFLRIFIEVSNAACKSVIGKTRHACRAAVDACGAVFQAVLIARKMDDAEVGSPSSASAPAVEATSKAAASPTLCRLAWEEKDALVSFAVGCTRFAASPAVQTVGVRLLSSVLVAAPEIFLELGATQEAKPSKVAATAETPPDGDALLTAASALQSIALMHADRATRVLAEEVLRMLEKAYSTVDGTLRV